MPQRFLRPQIRQSKRWNSLGWVEQSFYIRLLTLVDDFARYEADPDLLRSEAFPFGDPAGQMLSSDNICCHLTTLASKDMLLLYEVGGKKYLQLTRWQERTRALESRFPAPNNTICQHLTTSDNKCQPPTPSPSPSPPSTPTPPRLPKNGECVFQLIEMLNKEYERPPTHRWSCEEEHLVAEVARGPDAMAECRALIAYRRSLPLDLRRYFPKTVTTLLRGWSGALDLSRQPIPVDEAKQREMKERLKQFGL